MLAGERQGRGVDRNGRLRPGPSDHVRVHNATVSPDVAPGSAVIITLDDCG